MIEASGGFVSVNDSLSAGSGGTIFITTNFINGSGYNYIKSAGGDSYNNLGAGGGGLIKVTYVNRKQNPEDSLWINISQGYQMNSPNQSVYSNGIFYGPVCPGGQ